MKSELEKFLILFNNLRREAKNSPANLSWLSTEKPNVSELCEVDPVFLDTELGDNA